MTVRGCNPEVCAEQGHIEGTDGRGRCLRCEAQLWTPHRSWQPNPRLAVCDTCLMPIDDCFCETGERRTS